LDTAWHMAIFAIALLIALNALDDLFVDANYFLRGLHRVGKRAINFAELGGPQQRIAIMVPAWQESAVIGRMLDHNLRSLEYDNFTIFCGTYQNDPATQACVEDVASSTTLVRKVVVPHDGPTSKADCLNWIYQGVLLEEERQGTSFDILLMQDAEDVIHPLALRLYNALIPAHDFVQTPVFSLQVPCGQLVAGTYIDEFAEHHLKDMLVRQAIGGLVPSAGVGSAFHGRAFKEIAAAHDQKPFNVGSLTEDYEIGFRFRLANKKVCFACRSLIQRVAAASPEPRMHEEYLATREYFPDDVRSSIKQRSRWLCAGLVLSLARSQGAHHQYDLATRVPACARRGHRHALCEFVWLFLHLESGRPDGLAAVLAHARESIVRGLARRPEGLLRTQASRARPRRVEYCPIAAG
jgi:adsorption protein B